MGYASLCDPRTRAEMSREPSFLRKASNLASSTSLRFFFFFFLNFDFDGEKKMDERKTERKDEKKKESEKVKTAASLSPLLLGHVGPEHDHRLVAVFEFFLGGFEE